MNTKIQKKSISFQNITNTFHSFLVSCLKNVLAKKKLNWCLIKHLPIRTMVLFKFPAEGSTFVYNMQATLFSQRRVSQKWTAALKVAISPTLKVAIFPTLMQLVLPGLGEKRICGEFFGGTLFKWDIIPIAR